VIKVNISEIKNRLSYYLKLVKGGEEIEIIDRKTPLARVIRIGDMLEGPEGTLSISIQNFQLHDKIIPMVLPRDRWRSRYSAQG